MSLDLALANLLSPPVLAFVLGIVAVLIRSDLAVPETVTKVLSIYLLLAIGIKGGVAMRGESLGDLVVPLLVTLALGLLIPVLAFVALRWMTRLGPLDRGALAAHYGSTSLVTFTAALVFLETAAIAAPGYGATLLTVLEIPGIIVGLLLAARHTARRVAWGTTLREVLAGTSIVLLAGGLLIGFASGPAGYERVEPFFGGVFPGVLAIFLLCLGLAVGKRLGSLRSAGAGVVVFALVFPLVVGSLGVITATAVGMGVGGAVVLGVLCASASYIAAPAAVRFALPDANLAISLAASIGVTFPFNLVVGIPLLAWLAGVL